MIVEIRPFQKKIWLSSPTMHGDEIKYVQEAYIKELKDLFARCEESRYAGSGSLDGATACRRARELVKKLESLKLKA